MEWVKSGRQKEEEIKVGIEDKEEEERKKEEKKGKSSVDTHSFG